MTAERTRPTAAFLLAHPAHFIALGFGSGLSPWAPGTVGSLLAWALYPLLRSPVSEGVFLLLLALPLSMLVAAFAWHHLPRRIKERVPEGWQALLRRLLLWRDATGRRCAVNPQGTLTAGRPARFALTVNTSFKYICNG